jgi:hypothetical protein
VARDCDKIHPLLSLYLEEQLSAKDRLLAARHLNDCAQARREMEDYRAQRRALLAFPEPEPPVDLHARILRHVYGRGGAPMEGDSRSRVGPRVGGWSRSRVVGLAAACLGAVLFLDLYSDFGSLLRSSKERMEAPEPPVPFTASGDGVPAEDGRALPPESPAAKEEASTPRPQAAARPGSRRRTDPNLRNVSAGDAAGTSQAPAGRVSREDEEARTLAAMAARDLGTQDQAPMEAGSEKVAREAAVGEAKPEPGRSSAAAPAAYAGAAADGEEDAPGWGGNRGPYGQPHAEVIRDPVSFMAYWQLMMPGEPVPQVDFRRSSVAVLFLGTRPTAGYSVRFEGIRTGEAVTLLWREEAPAPDAMTAQVLTRPWAMRVIPRPSKPVLFLKQP